jgi:hypothetical protein
MFDGMTNSTTMGINPFQMPSAKQRDYVNVMEKSKTVRAT